MKKSLALILASGLAASVAMISIADDQTGTAPAKQTDKHDHKHDHKHDGKEGTKDPHGVSKAEVGKPAPAFTLKTTDGADWSLADHAGKIIVLEWVNPECPVCVRVMGDGTVADAIKEVGSDVVYVAVNSSVARPSSLDATAKYLADAKIAIPALLDRDGKVGMMYDARTTPHCYVIDSKGVLRYSGAIDDGNGGSKGKMNYVVNAVKQIKAGETVSPDSTKPYGCGVKYAKH